MIYEIINPSDSYTIEGDFKVCAVATAILGKGAYGLESSDGSQEMPIFLIVDADEWFRQTFGGTFEEALKSIPHDALATCLDSVLCCEAVDRTAYEIALALIAETQNEVAAIALRAQWHDQRRTSNSDIGRRAWALAERIRGKWALATEHM